MQRIKVTKGVALPALEPGKPKGKPKLMTARMLFDNKYPDVFGIRQSESNTATDELLFADEESKGVESFKARKREEDNDDHIEQDDEEGGVAINLRVLQELRQAFIEADTDGGGGLEMDEFVEAFGKIIGKGLTEQELTNLFMKIDANSDGSVDWEEFTEYMLLENKGNADMVQENVSVTYCPREEGHQDVSITRHFHRKMIVSVIPLHFSHQYLTVSTDGLIKVWDYTKGNRYLQTVSVPQGRSKSWCTGSVHMTRSNRLAVSMMNRSIFFFDLPGFDTPCNLHPLPGSPMCISYYHGEHSDGNEVLMCGDDLGTLSVWFLGEHWWFPNNATSGNKAMKPRGIQSYHSHKIHSDFVTKVGYVSDLGSIVTTSLDCTVVLSSLDRPTKQRAYTGHSKPVNAFAWIAKLNTMASVGMEHKVHLWNPYTCITSMLFEGHTAGITQLCMNAIDHQLISVSTDKHILVWNLNTNELKQELVDRELHRPQNVISTLHFDEKNECIITASNKLKMWTLSRRQPSPNRSHQSPVNMALFNSVFHQVVSASALDVHIWNINTGKLTLRFRNPHGNAGLTAMCFDGAGRRLITGADDGTIRMWNFNNGACLREFKRSRDGIPPPLIARSAEDVEITHLAYVTQDLSSGRKAAIELTREYILATGWDRRIFVFDEEQASDEHEYSHYLPRNDQIHRGHRDDITRIVHCPPHLLASCSYDGKIKTWSLQGGYLRRSFDAFPVKEKALMKTESEKTELGFLLRTKSGKTKTISKRHFRSMKGPISFDFGDPATDETKTTPGEGDDQSVSDYLPEDHVKVSTPTSQPSVDAESVSETTSNSPNKSKLAGDQETDEKKKTVEGMLYIERLNCLLTCSTDGYLRFWDAEKGVLLGSRCIAISSRKTVDTRPTQSLTAVNIDTRNNYVATGDSFGFLQVWNISDLEKEHLDQPSVDNDMKNQGIWRAHFQQITSVELADLQKTHFIVTSSLDCLVMLWRIDGQCVGMFGQKRTWSLSDRLSWVQFKDKLVRKITVLGILRRGMDTLVGQNARKSGIDEYLRKYRKEVEDAKVIKQNKYEISKKCFFARHMISYAEDALKISEQAREQQQLLARHEIGDENPIKSSKHRAHLLSSSSHVRRIGVAERSWKATRRIEAEKKFKLRLPGLEDISSGYDRIQRRRKLRLSKSTPIL